MEELMSDTKQVHTTKGPYEIKAEKILNSYDQEQRGTIYKGLLTILSGTKH